MGNDDTRKQLNMCDRASRRVAWRWEALLEIQEGPNPLSAGELRAIAAKYPERYGDVIRAYLNGKQ